MPLNKHLKYKTFKIWSLYCFHISLEIVKIYFLTPYLILGAINQLISEMGVNN